MGVCAYSLCLRPGFECVHVRKRSLERGPAAAALCGKEDRGEGVE